MQVPASDVLQPYDDMARIKQSMLCQDEISLNILST